MKMKTFILFVFSWGTENEIKVFLSFTYVGVGKLSSAFCLVSSDRK